MFLDRVEYIVSGGKYEYFNAPCILYRICSEP